MALTKATRMQAYAVDAEVDSTVQARLDKYQTVPHIAALRNVNPMEDGTVYYMKYHTYPGYGGGFFAYDASSTFVDDDGWCVVTQTGKRLIRICAQERMNLQEFGAAPGIGIYCDDAFDNMLKSTSQFGVFKCVLPHGRDPSVSYRFARGHQWYADITPLRFVGEEVRVSEGVRIAQEYAGVLFTIQNSGSTHFMSSLIQGFRFASTLGSAAGVRAIKVSDSWRYCIRDCFFRNYQGTAPIWGYNENSWTESLRLERVETRSCRGMAIFTRSANAGATDSFFRLQVDDCNFQADQPSSTGLQFGTGSDTVRAYSCDITIGGWFEGGGGHSFISALDNATVEGQLTLTSDGYAGSTGTDLVPVVKRGRNGFIDLKVISNNSQASYVDITSRAGVVNDYLWYLAKNVDFPAQLNVDGRTSVWCRGAKIMLKAIAGTSSATYTFGRMQPGRSYRCTLSMGASFEGYSETYIITAQGSSNLADVVFMYGTNSAGIRASMKCQVYGGGTGGASSPNNGLRFDVVIDGTNTTLQGRTVYIEIEMI